MTVAGKNEVVDVPGARNQPWAIALGSQGDLWFTDIDQGVIRRLSVNGTWREFAVPLPAYSITQGPDKDMWFVDSARIGRLTPGGTVTRFSLGAQSRPGDIVLGPDDALWFSDLDGDAIGRISASGEVTTFSLPQKSRPFSMTLGPDNHLWFTASGLNRIGRISTAGQLAEFDLPSPHSGVNQITQGPDGNLWFTESDGGRIGRITPSGAIAEVEVPTRDGYPAGLAFGPDGNLWIAYNRTSKILRMTLGGTPITGPCTASDTILCIDDAPGDRRFQVEIEYETEQAGGRSGHGRAVPLSSLGVARGGLFWFFGADNPEIIVKILNGCATNQKYWAFISGGTNVGLIITVSDTVTGEVHTYYNRDLTPFAPIQDTRALSCGE
jgi:virginiamycin B lyase